MHKGRRRRAGSQFTLLRSSAAFPHCTPCAARLADHVQIQKPGAPATEVSVEFANDGGVWRAPDVADFLVKQIDDDAFLHKTPVLTS
jgi:hypothetical protein